MHGCPRHCRLQQEPNADNSDCQPCSQTQVYDKASARCRDCPPFQEAPTAGSAHVHACQCRPMFYNTTQQRVMCIEDLFQDGVDAGGVQAGWSDDEECNRCPSCLDLG